MAEIGTTLFGPFSVAEGDTLEFEVVSLISGPPTGLVTMEMSFFDTNTKMFEDTFSLRLGTHSVPNEQSKEVWGDQGGGAIDTLYMQMYSSGKGEWYAGSPDGEAYNSSAGTLVWDHGNGGRTPTGDWQTNLMGRPVDPPQVSVSISGVICSVTLIIREDIHMTMLQDNHSLIHSMSLMHGHQENSLQVM